MKTSGSILAGGFFMFYSLFYCNNNLEHLTTSLLILVFTVLQVSL